jgi:hypothetical protein
MSAVHRAVRIHLAGDYFSLPLVIYFGAFSLMSPTIPTFKQIFTHSPPAGNRSPTWWGASTVEHSLGS